ncbi:MAG: adaptor protein [Nitrospirales bacterium]|nr:adaptor protein [Nitrospirales bacterium]
MLAAPPIPDVTEYTSEEIEVRTKNDLEGEVIVHNCDCHTYEQVIELFCNVIPRMSSPKAFELAWKIDHEGSACVFSGERNLADQIGTQLAEGGLKVEVR